jgi:hypothetical protein
MDILICTSSGIARTGVIGMVGTRIGGMFIQEYASYFLYSTEMYMCIFICKLLGKLLNKLLVGDSIFIV